MRISLSTSAARRVAPALAALLMLAPIAAQGQQRNIRGVVTDSSGNPLSNAEVRIMDIGRLARTDIRGGFALNRISDRVVDLTVRRLGYQVRFVRVSLINGEGDSLRVVLYPEPIMLREVEIEAPGEQHPFFNEYEQRRARGVGTFITNEQMSALNTSYPSDAFRRVPGVRFVRAPGGQGVRFMSATGMRRGSSECMPTIWVDGTAAVGMEIDEIRAGDIHGIEIYRGASTTPHQFVKAGAAHCGAIVVWTKRRGK